MMASKSFVFRFGDVEVQEREFSLTSICKTKRRNRLSVPRLSRALIVHSYLMDRERRESDKPYTRTQPSVQELLDQ